MNDPLHVVPELTAPRSSDGAAAKRMAQKARLLQDSVSVTEAAVTTGASEQRLLGLGRRGAAIAFTVDGETLFPAWQLRANELVPVIPGVRVLAESFPDDLAALNAWIQTPHEDFGGAQPAEVLEDDGVDHVLVAVRAIAAAGR